MAPEQEKLFVVVDPTDDSHVALERAIITSQLRQIAPKIFVFLTVDSEVVDTRAINDNLFRNRDWFETKILNPLAECGFEYELETSWCSQWYESIMLSAGQFGADMIMLPVRDASTPRRFAFGESRWALLKNATCPVLLVRPGAREKRKVVLAAVNFQAIRDEQQMLNERILNHAKRTAERYGATLHVVNAYRDSLHYPDRGRLANQTGLPATNIHVEYGHTNEVIAAVSKQIDADLAIIGTLNQRGMKKSRRGNTAARVIASLDVDTMVLN